MKRSILFFFSLFFSVSLIFAQDVTVKGVPAPAAGTAEAKPAPLPRLWTTELAVEDGLERFDSENFYGYSIVVYEVKGSQVSSLLKEEIKKKADKFSTKKGIAVAEKTSMPEIHTDYMDVYAKFEDGRERNSVRMIMAFVHDGKAINPDDEPEAHEKAEKFMYDLSVKLNRAVVDEQVGDQEKTLAGLEKELEKLQRENQKLYDTIDKNESNYQKAQNDQADAERDLETARADLEAYEESVGNSADEKQLKELSKMRKNVSNLENKIGKLISDQQDYQNNVSDAKNAIPLNEQHQEEMKKQIEQQKAVVTQYRQKLADVH